jgi:hypothetical protein
MQKRSGLLAIVTFLSTLSFTSLASSCEGPNCCGGNSGGISYCDSSVGRFVCRNGEYSACYCTRHAVMDLQKIAGCCLWQGGVMKVDPFGMVICADGSVSEICSLQSPPEKIVSW